MSVKTTAHAALLLVAALGLLVFAVIAAGCGGSEASSAPAAKATLNGLSVEMHYDPG